MMRKNYYIHFIEGWKLDFLMRIKAFSSEGAYKKAAKMVGKHPNQDLREYRIYDEAEVARLASERLEGLADKESIRRLFKTYKMVWRSTDVTDKSDLISHTEIQLQSMNWEELRGLRAEILKNGYPVRSIDEPCGVSDKADALIQLAELIDTAIEDEKYKLLRLKESGGECELRAVLESYYIVVARIKLLRSLIREEYYDVLLDKYFKKL